MLTDRLADCRLGHRGTSPHRAPSLAPQMNISWYSMPWCRVFTQGSSPAQFRASSRSLSLPMGVDEPACIFVFLVPVLLGGRGAICRMQVAGPNVFAVPSSMPRGCLDARVVQPAYISMLFGDVSGCRSRKAMPGRLPAFGQGRLDSRASVHRWHPLAQQAVGC